MGAWGAVHMAAVYNGLAGFRKTLVSNVHSEWMSINCYFWPLLLAIELQLLAPWHV